MKVFRSVLLATLIISAADGCRSDNVPDILSNLPEPQMQFCQVLGQGNGKPNLDAAIASLGPSAKFVAWHGQGSVHPRNDGKTLAITFTPACPAPATAVTLEDDGTLSANDALGNAVQSSDFSRGMIVSGMFKPNAGGMPTMQFQMLSAVKFSQPGRDGSTVMASSSDALTGEDQQKRFCQILKNQSSERQRIEDAAATAASRNPLNAPNVDDQKQALIVKTFNDLYALVGPSGNFTGWRGKLTTQINYSDDRPPKQTFVVLFVPDCFDEATVRHLGDIFTLYTHRGPLEDTNVSPNSALGQAMRQMDLSKPKYTVSGQFVWAPPPPKGGGMWVPAVDYRYHFYSGNFTFYEGSYHFVARFSQIAP
jgi:hypothetical protein